MATNFFKNRNGLALGNLATAPASPVNGDMYYDTTLNKFRRYQNGAWGNFGGGSGSGSGKNYLTDYTASTASGVPNSGNGDLENASTAGFSLGTVALTANLPTGVPTFGSGASGNLSLGVVSSSQLAGLYSLSLVSSAATSPGNFVATDAFFIDLEDQAKMLSFSFNYKAQVNPTNGNFSGTSSNSFGVAIYDVTNSQWIIPAGVFNLVQNAGVGQCTGTFQTSSNGTQYRVVMYNANATAGAITMYLDDFICGPQSIQKGPAMTDWQSYTVAVSRSTSGGGKGTIVYDQAVWRRVGDSVEIMWVYSQSSTGAAGSGTTLCSLPPGLVADTAKCRANLTTGSILGPVWMGRGSAGDYTSSNVSHAIVFLATTTGFSFIDGANVSTNLTTTADINPVFENYSGLTMGLTIKIPIVGWSSNSSLSSDTDSRVVSASYGVGTATTVGNGTFTAINFTGLLYDTHSAVSTTTPWTYVVPVSGYYDIAASVRATVALTGQDILAVFKNGVEYARLFDNTGVGSSIGGMSGSTTVQCSAGDILTVRVFQSSGASRTFDGGNLSINRRSGPAVVAASEVVACTVYAALTTTLTNSAAPIVFNTVQLDTHNAYNSSTGTYVAPVTGYYRMSCVVPISNAANSQLLVAFKINGTANTNTGYAVHTTGSIGGALTLAPGIVFKLNAGDTVQVIAASAAANSSLNGNGQSFSIHKI
jgi:hypothetical protein